jgi:excisionase family DNA binding protein
MERFGLDKTMTSNALEETKTLEAGINALGRMIASAFMDKISTRSRNHSRPIWDNNIQDSFDNSGDREETRLALSVGESAKLLGVNKTSVYEAVRTGQLPSIKFGRRILIPRTQLIKILEEANIYEGR